MSKNLLTRILVAAAAIPIILWISYEGGWWLFGMVALLAVLALWEFLLNEGFRPDQLLFWLSTLVVMAIICVSTGVFETAGILKTSTISHNYFLTVLLFLSSGMWLAIKKDSPALLFRKYCRLIWGAAYIGLLYPFVYHVGVGTGKLHGGDSLLFLFGLLWVGDTTAMAVGKKLGKHKLAPTVSPNKTVEGFVGGIVGAVAIGVLMHFWKFNAISLLHLIIIAIGCSVFGQLGDLVESMWKRSLDLKDSSRIIPGHGGVLDRFDSLLFAAPFLYFYVIFFVKSQ